MRGTYGLYGAYGLIDGHRIGLVDGQERRVDVVQCQYFGRIFRIASDIDAQTGDGEYVSAILTLFGMEVGMSLRSVVCGNGLDMYLRYRVGHGALGPSLRSRPRMPRPRSCRRR